MKITSLGFCVKDNHTFRSKKKLMKAISEYYNWLLPLGNFEKTHYFGDEFDSNISVAVNTKNGSTLAHSYRRSVEEAAENVGFTPYNVTVRDVELGFDWKVTSKQLGYQGVERLAIAQIPLLNYQTGIRNRFDNIEEKLRTTFGHEAKIFDDKFLVQQLSDFSKKELSEFYKILFDAFNDTLKIDSLSLIYRAGISSTQLVQAESSCQINPVNGYVFMNREFKVLDGYRSRR